MFYRKYNFAVLIALQPSNYMDTSEVETINLNPNIG